MYTEEKGKKTAQALPNMWSASMEMAKNNPVPDSDQEEDIKVKATGKTKKVAGYRCEEYEVQHDEGHSLNYVTDELDFSWPQAFGQMMAKAMSKESNQELSQISGMPLESTNFDKKGKQDSFWTTTEVKTTAYSFDNSQYDFENYEGADDAED